MLLTKPHPVVCAIVGFAALSLFGCNDSLGPHPSPLSGGLIRTVEVSPATTSLEEGSSGTLKCMAMDATQVVVYDAPSWSSSDTTIVAVSSNGALVAQRPGQTTVTCTVRGKSAGAVVDVVPSPVAFVEVSPGAASLQPGTSIQLTGAPHDAEGRIVDGHTIQWTSTDPTVATVSATGVVSGVRVGTASIIGMSGGRKATAGAHVSNGPPTRASSVSVRVDSSSIRIGQLTRAVANVLDANQHQIGDCSLSWSVSNPSVISAMSSSGDTAVVVGVAAGSATVTATCQGVSGNASVNVLSSSVQSIVINSPPSLGVGQTGQATASALDANGNVLTGVPVTWSALNPTIAFVSATGLITAVSAGTATIRAAADGKSATASVTVTAPVAAVATVTPTLAAANLAPGQTTQATAVVKDGSGNVLTGKTVLWSSLNTSVATVSASGIVTAVASGTAAIRAAVDGQTGDATLGVASATVATVSASVTSASLLVGQTTQASATATDSAGHVLTGKAVAWSSLNPSIATVSAAGVVTAVSAGAATIRATIDTKTGDVVVSVGASVTTGPALAHLAELPRTYVNTTYPTFSGTVRNVASGGDLQAAINAAQPGDQIVLAPGATYKGNYVLPAKACTGYIVIRSGGLDSDYPAAGQRITPAYAPKLAKLVTPTVSPALLAKNGACKWWISRVEITATAQSATVNYNYGLVVFGQGETSLSALPTDLVLDRVYVHGAPTLSTQRAIAFNGGSAALIDSWVSDIHWPGTDTQAVCGWAGPGPYKIVNNYLDAASENIMFGGADPVIANVSPSDIEIRLNHITKPLSYKGAGFAVKNLIELKHAKRVLIEGNVMENSWADAQIGWGLIFQSVTDHPELAPWTETADVTMRYNIVRNVNGGLDLTSHGWNGSGIAMSRVTVRDNLFQNVGGDQLSVGLQLLNDLTDVLFAHNTILRNTETMGMPFSLEGVGAARIELRDNLVGAATPYGAVFRRGGLLCSAALDAYAGPAWVFSHNVDWGLSADINPSACPTDNFWAATQLEVGFAADWSLNSSSPYKGTATDGTDPGADISHLGSLAPSASTSTRRAPTFP